MARTCPNRQTEKRTRSEVGLFIFISWTRQWQWRHQQHHCRAVTYACRFSISRCFWNVCRLRTHRSRVESSQAYGARETVASWYDNYCLFFNALSGTFDSISLALSLFRVRWPANWQFYKFAVQNHFAQFARTGPALAISRLPQHARRDVCKFCVFFSLLFLYRSLFRVQSNWFFTISNSIFMSAIWIGRCVFVAKRECFCCLIVVVRACNRNGENKCIAREMLST